MLPQRAHGRGLRDLWRSVGPGLLVSGLILVLAAVGGELYHRGSAPPFDKTAWPSDFHSEAGFLLVPGGEARTTNHVDYWTQQRANSLGFLDREPVPAEARPGSCHLVFIGDSMIEAHQVPIEQKVQVVLEKLAAERAPQLGLTTAAFGQQDTGQLSQLPYYDLFARKQAPRIVVLVFHKNDFADNSAVLQAIGHGRDPEHMPRMFARRNADGSFVLQPVDPNWQQFLLPRPARAEPRPSARHVWLSDNSSFYRWLHAHLQVRAPRLARWLDGTGATTQWSDMKNHFARVLAERPAYAQLLAGREIEAVSDLDAPFFQPEMPAVFREALAFTGFALDQFQQRARRDGFKLVILATQLLRKDDGPSPAFDRLAQMAAARGIPLVDLHAFIRSQRGDLREARFRRDSHWSPQAHKWAAQAMLEQLVQHPEWCR